MSKTTSLSQIQQLLIQFNSDRNWGQYHNPRNLVMALSVETAELLELFLWSSDQGPQPPVAGREQDVEDEAADVLICLLNFWNALKYPIEKSSGSLKKHDEL